MYGHARGLCVGVFVFVFVHSRERRFMTPRDLLL